MQATRSDIRRNENVEIATGELIKNTQTFFLCYVTGQQTDAMTVRSKAAPDIFTTMLGVSKNNGAIWPLFFNQRLQQTHFLFVGRIEEFFFNTMTCLLFRFDFNVLGVIHLFERQFANAVREGGRKQHVQALSGWRHTAEQPTNVFNKAEIVHTIGFIQYHDLNRAQVDMVLFCVVNETTSSADKNIDAAFQHFQLFVIAITAISQA